MNPDPGSGFMAVVIDYYRMFQGSWQKGGTLYIWYRWTYLEILLGGGSHKLFFLFGVS